MLRRSAWAVSGTDAEDADTAQNEGHDGSMEFTACNETNLWEPYVALYSVISHCRLTMVQCCAIRYI